MTPSTRSRWRLGIAVCIGIFIFSACSKQADIAGSAVHRGLASLQLGSFAGSVSSSAATTNLIANPDFESQMSSWVNWGNASTVTGNSNSGTYAIRVGTGAGGAGQSVFSGTRIGSTYQLTAYGKLGSGSDQAYIGIKFVDASGASIVEQTAQVTTTSYAQYSMKITAPSGATDAIVYVWKNAGSSYLYADDLSLTPLAPPVVTQVSVPNAAVASPTIGQGASETISAGILSNVDLSNVIAQIRVLDANYNLVASGPVSTLNLSANQVYNLSYDFVSSANTAAGTYRIAVGVWSGDWSTTYVYANPSTTFQVQNLIPSVALSSTSINQSTISSGGAEAISANIVSNVNLSNLIGQIRVLNSTGNIVDIGTVTGINLSANQPYALNYTYLAPASIAQGTYTIIVALWSGDWNITYLYNTTNVSFQINNTPITPAQTKVSVSSASVAAPTISAGQVEAISASAVSNVNIPNAIVQIRVTDQNWNMIDSKEFDHVNLIANQPSAFSYGFQSASNLASGSYVVLLAVWSSDWTITYLYDATGVSFQVGTAVTPPPPPVMPSPSPITQPSVTPSVAPSATPTVIPSATPTSVPTAANGSGYPFGSRKDAYVAGIKVNSATQAAQDSAIESLYNTWKTHLYPGCGGYYVQFNTTNAAVSEGIGYGMLITVLMSGYDASARTYFDGLFHYARAFPAYGVGDSNLMDWKTNYDCTSAGGGWAAPDGDLDIAMALLMADRQWGSTGAINYKAEALKTINSIKTHYLSATGYISGGNAPDMSRTSDLMITHFRAFKKATGDSSWDNAINYSLSMAAQVQNQNSTGLLPDWIVGLPSNPVPSPGGRIEGALEGDYAWNACRDPWRLGADYVTSGDMRSHDITAKMMDFLNRTTSGDPHGIAMGYTLSGTPLATAVDWTSPSFAGPATVGAMVDSRFQTYLEKLWALDVAQPGTGYYDTELQLLPMIVASGNWWNP